MAAIEQYLFKPGDGAVPPALTGRTSEQAVLLRCLAGLEANAAPAHNVVLVGPRGNGKTVLLNWFEIACRDGRHVDTVRLTPRDIPNLGALIETLVPLRGFAKLLRRKVGIASVGSAEWSSNAVRRNLVHELSGRCMRRPLAVLLDEAHTLGIDVGGTLLNASQQVRANAPFLLVLAGTPGLPPHLDAMDASFWDRLGDGLLGIGRLSEAAAVEALAEPLQAKGVSTDADALTAAVAHSQQYPYFIQLWGEAMWQRHLATGATRLTTNDVAAAMPHVMAQTTNYYQGRFAELEADGLVPAASAIASIFRDDSDATASNQKVDATLAAVGIDGERDRFNAREALNRLGYIWRPPGQLPPVTWSAGIPSLMTHVLAHTESASLVGMP